jgi:hypothetical protein
MAPTVYQIDPDPDTVIILRNPCTNFAPWELVAAEPEQLAPEAQLDASDEEVQSSEDVPLDEFSIEVSLREPIAGSWTRLQKSHIEGITLLPATTEESFIPDSDDIHYHVSSRHLMLASPMFKRMLTKDGFAELSRCETDGLFHIEASDWDPEALLIVL